MQSNLIFTSFIVLNIINFLYLLFRISGKECKFSVKQKFLCARFNPTDDDTFFVLYSNTLTLGKLLPAFELFKNEEDQEEKEIKKNYRIDAM